MEDLFDVFLVVCIIIGAIAKSAKRKEAKAKDKAKKAAASPVQAAKPVTEPAKSVTAVPKATNSIENAINAFSELLDAGNSLPNPDKPAPAKRAKTSIEAEAAMKQRAEIVKARVLESLTGVSPTDEHGCIGGSMPDHEAEGETIAEHAEHEQNRQQRLAEEAALNAETFRKPTAADLRRAVVMSEILDKPVSLRGRRI